MTSQLKELQGPFTVRFGESGTRVCKEGSYLNQLLSKDLGNSVYQCLGKTEVVNNNLCNQVRDTEECKTLVSTYRSYKSYGDDMKAVLAALQQKPFNFTDDYVYSVAALQAYIDLVKDVDKDSASKVPALDLMNVFGKVLTEASLRFLHRQRCVCLGDEGHLKRIKLLLEVVKATFGVISKKYYAPIDWTTEESLLQVKNDLDQVQLALSIKPPPSVELKMPSLVSISHIEAQYLLQLCVEAPNTPWSQALTEKLKGLLKKAFIQVMMKYTSFDEKTDMGLPYFILHDSIEEHMNDVLDAYNDYAWNKLMETLKDVSMYQGICVISDSAIFVDVAKLDERIKEAIGLTVDHTVLHRLTQSPGKTNIQRKCLEFVAQKRPSFDLWYCSNVNRLNAKKPFLPQTLKVVSEYCHDSMKQRVVDATKEVKEALGKLYQTLSAKKNFRSRDLPRNLAKAVDKLTVDEVSLFFEYFRDASKLIDREPHDKELVILPVSELERLNLK